jgi:polysaccharide deacetylase 2 family uncharacterized protein YibQ
LKGGGDPGRRSPLWPIAVLAILVSSTLALLEWIDHAGRVRPPARRGVAGGHARPRTTPSAGTAAPSEDEDWVPEGRGPCRVAIVIDDVGFEERPALDLAALGLPLTFAILPGQRFSRDLSSRLRLMGHEVILHLPMEPLGYPARDPGEGSITEGMPPEAIARQVREDLDEVPGAVGVNNHMGSRTTADPTVMRAVLGVLRERGLYFLDSRTTPETVGRRMALQMGVPSLERSVFLDDQREESYIEGQVRELLRTARARGSAVAIGHADAATAAALRRCVGLLRSDDIEVVPASDLAGTDDRGSG